MVQRYMDAHAPVRTLLVSSSLLGEDVRFQQPPYQVRFEGVPRSPDLRRLLTVQNPGDWQLCSRPAPMASPPSPTTIRAGDADYRARVRDVLRFDNAGS